MAEPDIFAQARAAHDGATTTAEIRPILSAVVDAIIATQAARAADEVIVVSPFEEQSAVEEADRRIAATYLRERRLTEASRLLGARLAELQEREEDTARRARYTAASAHRETEAARIRAAWAQHAAALIGLLRDIDAADREVSGMYDTPPRGEGRIASVAEGTRVMHPTTPNVTLMLADALCIPAVPAWGAPGIAGARVMLI